MSLTTLERLNDKFTVQPNGCWQWHGALRRGYGTIRTGSAKDGTRKMSPAHRVAYQELVGQIPVGLELDHLCRNTACVNPSHLEPVTPKVNKLRSEGFAGINGRKDRCSKDHPFNEANTHIDYRGHRKCRACDRESKRSRDRARADKLVTE